MFAPSRSKRGPGRQHRRRPSNMAPCAAMLLEEPGAAPGVARHRAFNRRAGEGAVERQKLRQSGLLDSDRGHAAIRQALADYLPHCLVAATQCDAGRHDVRGVLPALAVAAMAAAAMELERRPARLQVSEALREGRRRRSENQRDQGRHGGIRCKETAPARKAAASRLGEGSRVQRPRPNEAYPK